MSDKNRAWYGTDLDETLAEYTGGLEHDVIGSPIKEQCDRVRAHLSDGYQVKLVTARATLPEPLLSQFMNEWAKWSRKEFGQVLEVTCSKDFAMIALYDDRAKQVEPNTGRLIEDLFKDTKNELYDAKQRSQGLFNQLMQLNAEKGQ